MRVYKLRYKLLLLFTSTVVTVLLAEVGVRWFHPSGLRHSRIAVYEGRATHWAPPGSVVLANDGKNHYLSNIVFKHCYAGPGAGNLEPGNVITYRTSSWGFRDVEHRWTKPPDTYRVLVLGDSFAFGEGTRFEETFTQRLASEFHSKRILGRSIEFVNMAMPGDGTVEQYHIYDWVSETLDPDLVILQWNTNDFPVDSVMVDHVKLIGVAYQKMYAGLEKYEWSALVHLARHRLRTNRISKELIEATNRDLELGAVNFLQIREFFRKVTEEDDREFVLLIFPELIRFDDYPYSRIVDALEELCSMDQIPCVNLLPSLSQYQDEELWAHPTDHHPNHLAHEIASRELTRFLEQYFGASNAVGR